MGCRLVLDRPSLDFAFTDILKAERPVRLSHCPSRGHCTLRGILFDGHWLDDPLEVRMVRRIRHFNDCLMYPVQRTIGKRGYLAKPGSVSESLQR
jgi:hypothetical protein